MIEDDFMVRVFIQTLVVLSYDKYLSLLTNSIMCFADIEDSFLNQYFQHVVYHMFLMEFTKIHL